MSIEYDSLLFDSPWISVYLGIQMVVPSMLDSRLCTSIEFVWRSGPGEDAEVSYHWQFMSTF